MVMERVPEEEEEDTAEPSATTQCTHHPPPHKPTTDSGICPFCLQEKLTKLFTFSSSSSSSTSPFPIFPSCPSPPSPTKPTRSDSIPPSLNTFNITHHLKTSTSCCNESNDHECNSTRAFLRIPFVQTQKKKKNKSKDKDPGEDKDYYKDGIFFSRSKSTTTPRVGLEEDTPRRRGFFRSLVSLSKNPSARKIESRDWREEEIDDESTPRKRMRILQRGAWKRRRLTGRCRDPDQSAAAAAAAAGASLGKKN